MNAKSDYKKKQERKFKNYVSGPYFGFIYFFFWFYFLSILTHIVLRYGLSHAFKENKEFFLILTLCIPFNFSFIALYFSRKFRERVSL